MAQEAAILDIGSSRITAMIARRGVNNTITVLGKGECEYPGYEDGEFYRPEELVNVVFKAVSAAETDANMKIRHLYIGVPGQFSVTQCKDVTMSLGKRRKVTDEDVDKLLSMGAEFEGASDLELINSQPVYFTLGDDRKLIQPVGMTAQRLSGYVSYMLAEKKFTDLFTRVAADIGIASVDFVSALLAETLCLFDAVVRDRYAVLVDVGYTVTDIAVARGDGIVRQFSFSMGGAHLTEDLHEDLSIRYSLAETLKRKIVLNLEFSPDDTYDLPIKERIMSLPATQVNDVAYARMNKLAKTINKCLGSCDLPPTTTYGLTGGGISYITGAIDYLSKKTDRQFDIVAPDIPRLNKPHLSSSVSLMDMVLGSSVPTKKKGFFAKLFER